MNFMQSTFLERL